jgi:ATP-dependent Lon protease
MDNKHPMTTRSKAINDKKDQKIEGNNINQEEYEELDEYGNIKDFIVHDIDQNPLKQSINQQLSFLRKKKKNKRNQKKALNNLLFNYILHKANSEIKNNRKIDKETLEDDNENSDSGDMVNTDSEDTEDTENTDFEDIEDTENTDSEDTEDTGAIEIDINVDTESDDENLFDFELDEFDEQYDEILDTRFESEDKDMEYFHNLDTSLKQKVITETKQIYEMNDSDIPLRFKIMKSNMDLNTKAIAIENIDKLSEMDVATGEHSKMDHWINGLIKLPFGKFQSLPVTSESPSYDKKKYIQDTFSILDKSIYGHKEAKTHILQVIGKWIQNPNSGGNVLAIQGPMGNGKTTLVKEGISKVLNRPFAFIALGGASDSAYFDGHCYTYEGSHWGRIVQILQDSKCMNPVIYFDELDKISDTQKGDEIIHLLTHITDSSQNNLFQDNYFPGVNIDLSKVLFIFSYNDESKVNKILRDRMYVIHTKGFNTKDKLKIAYEYLLPEIFNTYNINPSDIVFPEEIIQDIITHYTHSEEGVRNLKRCIESIISKINIYNLTYDPEQINNLSFTLNDFKIPFTIKLQHLSILLNKGNNDLPPANMYL